MNTISKEQALDIYWKYRKERPIDFTFYKIIEGLPEKNGIYSSGPKNDPDWRKTCWSIISLYSSNSKDYDTLCSSHITCLSKNTGEVIYDGTTSDEG